MLTETEAPPTEAPSFADTLADIVRAHDYNWMRARPEVLDALKRRRRESLGLAEEQLLADGGGRKCARAIAAAMDEIIAAILQVATKYAYPADNPSAAERVAVLAVGGYGRGTLAPGSDIDLLFLVPYRQTAWTESVIETILYLLWDMRLTVGHATRSVDECIRLARSDMTIRTALLEARPIAGDTALAATLEQRFDTAVARGTGPEFIAAKLDERNERHRRQGRSRYLVEPNVKEGKGGLRDLNTLFWIAKYFFRVRSGGELVKLGVFSPADHRLFRKCEDFLWAVRCHLHFLAGRAEERLSFDVQREIAVRLGYHTHPGLTEVERFMKHYFLIAKDVGDLTRILCAALEEEHVKQTPRLSRFLSSIGVGGRRKPREIGDFVVDNDRITVPDPEVFRSDPVNLVRIFWHALRADLSFHPDAMRAMRRSLTAIDGKLRADEEANRLFLDILTSKDDPETVLRAMNEAGVLGRFIPDFGRVVAMMQFNMYHHYTVDEHLIRAIGKLAEIESGRAGDLHDFAEALFPTIQNRRVLYVAMFLHDIAKGRPEDHSLAGARIARRLGPRLGLTPAECDTLAWLVEHHLLMSITAQSRDLGDPKTIADFAAVVQSVERLKLLEILTEADIAAVGPGVWNGWKAQLLHVLYDETELVLTAGHSRLSRPQRIAAAKAELAEALAEVPAQEREAYFARHEDPYWLRVGLEDKLAHFRFLERARRAGETVATAIRHSEDKGVTEITVLAPDVPRLLTVIFGACLVGGANIVSAEIFTTNDGMALDTIALSQAFARPEDEQRRAQRISDLIRRVLTGEEALPAKVEGRLRDRSPHRAFRRPTEVEINNDWSERYTAIELSGLDRPGLVYDVTRVMADLDLNIRSAQLATFGERAVDVFYVTGPNGKKITDARARERIVRRLAKAFEAGHVREQRGKGRKLAAVA